MESAISYIESPMEVNVTKATHFLDEQNGQNVSAYRMRSKPRGYVLIISLIEYTNNPKRSSAVKDALKMKILFEQMGFYVLFKKDLTGEKILEEVRHFSYRSGWKNVDSCFVIISGHGNRCRERNESIILGIDNVAVTWSEIFSFFSATKCPHLDNKPKVFIFQTCRGENRQISITSTVVQEHAKLFSEPEPEMELMSDYERGLADILIASSTLSGYVSYRDDNKGSLYFLLLYQIFMKHAHNTHIQDLFAMIEIELEKIRADDDKCQTASLKSKGFNKHLYLHPGLFENEKDSTIESCLLT